MVKPKVKPPGWRWWSKCKLCDKCGFRYRKAWLFCRKCGALMAEPPQAGSVIPEVFRHV